MAASLIGNIPAYAANVSQIDIEAHLDNDGRLQVTETHRMTLGKGAESEFRVFGRSVDQEIVLKAITRIDPDGAEHRLVDRVDQEVEGPDQYRYYSRGHVYFRYPTIAEDTTLAYRFEYELVNAVSPAWGLGAGWEPLVPEHANWNLWRRSQEIVADAKEAWPDPKRRYRLDHDVLFPDRGVWNDAALEINYRLVFDTAWREVDPNAELARVTPHVDYRVRRLFEFLPPGAPPAAAQRQAATRIDSVVVVVGAGLLLYFAIVMLEAWTVSGGKRLDPNLVADRLAELAPEEIQAKVERSVPPVSVDGVLGRLASEQKIAIDSLRQTDAQGRAEVQLRLLAPRESLPVFDLNLIEKLFDDEDVVSSIEIRQKAYESGVHPHQTLRSLVAAAAPQAVSHVSPVTIPLFVIGMAGAARQLQFLAEMDGPMVIMILGNLAALVIAVGWPKGWWHGGRPSRGLLVPLVLLAALFGALHLGVNRPYAAEVWVGSVVCILAYHLAQLINSRLPTRGPANIVRDLIRIGQFVKAELRGPAPRLDDRWIPQLLALGLGPQIEGWRQEFGGAMAGLSSTTYDDFAPRFSGAPFTGRLPEPFVGPPGWADVFFAVPDDDEMDMDDDAADSEDDES